MIASSASREAYLETVRETIDETIHEMKLEGQVQAFKDLTVQDSGGAETTASPK
jgi:hypothetical protein